MKTIKYYKSLNKETRQAAAEAIGTTTDYLYQICVGQRKASPKLAKRLSAYSGLTLAEIRPDIWGEE